MGSIIFGLAGIYSFIESEFPSRNLPSFEKIVSWWDWKIWIIIALVFAIVGTLEGTYRYVTKIKKEYADNLDKQRRLERITSRELYKPAENISKKIYDLYVYTRSISKANKAKYTLRSRKMKVVLTKLSSTGIFGEDMKVLANIAQEDDFKELQKQNKKIDNLALFQLLNRSLIFLSTAMAEQNAGIIPLIKDDKHYVELKEEISRLTIGLPQYIISKVLDSIDISDGINNLILVDISHEEVTDLASIMLQSVDKSSQFIVGLLTSSIRSDIKKFLNGEEIT